MHGEHSKGSGSFGGVEGSSPYARGARSKARATAATIGIIPVCTGSTRPAPMAGRAEWDHPRMHGEHSTTPGRRLPETGSSPYARGAPSGTQPALSGPGIIPVCTGSTHLRSFALSSPRDHPRMHGEHYIAACTFDISLGSSPYARGARAFRRVWKWPHGIIPVCTGSTCRSLGQSPPWPDHPRMHGEHRRHTMHTQEEQGSSPYARGAPVPLPPGDDVGGIIPVCTGSTRCLPLTPSRRWDHPRMHGEHDGRFRARPRINGSSPYARGALARVDRV